MDAVIFHLDEHYIRMGFFNLNSPASKNDGLYRLSKSLNKRRQCRVIVCGGDGTVLWVVEELVRYGIDTLEVPIGIIPIGTGNDFSRAMGWGGKQ